MFIEGKIDILSVPDIFFQLFVIPFVILLTYLSKNFEHFEILLKRDTIGKVREQFENERVCV